LIWAINELFTSQYRARSTEDNEDRCSLDPNRDANGEKVNHKGYTALTANSMMVPHQDYMSKTSFV